MRKSTPALPPAGLTRRPVDPGASAALEQSLIRLEPQRVWRASAASTSATVGASQASSTRKTGAPRAAAASRRRGEDSPAGEGGRAKTRPAAAQARSGGASLPTRIGVISDNHGYLDPAVLEVFAGVTHIIHAGDIMDPAILERLTAVAPVTAVSGNMDSGGLAAALPREVLGEVAGVRFLVGHKRKRLLRELAAGTIEGVTVEAPPHLVIYGHDHIPAAAWVDGILYLDPGSASAPHEEDDDPTVAIVEVRPAGLAVTFVPLARRDVEEAKRRREG
jgi:putative phosphoesterase